MQKYENTLKETQRRGAENAARAAENEKWMRRCLHLARCGRMSAAPNPMVGAVVVAHGRIVGEGYHVRPGQAHAEVNAISAVRPADRPLLRESTIYVNLEPGAHYGRTPPCAEVIIRTGIPRVVVGCVDPFSRVSGRGIDLLRRAGVEVTVGVLEAECLELNRRFITFHTHQRPYITLKWAVSSDGFIDRWRDAVSTPEEAASLPSPAGEGAEETAVAPPAALSTSRSLLRVHRLRALNQAILVGHNTLRLDRPRLDVRHWHGRNPLRIVLGSVAEGELPPGFTAFADIDTMLVALFRRGVQTLLVEGGSQTLQSFIDRGLWDEAFEELSSVVLGSGVPAPRMPFGVPRVVETAWGVSITHWRNV